GWADPLRLHSEARRARMLYDNAREVVAAELGCRPDDVTFTSSGTTAVHHGLLGLLRDPGTRLLAGTVEHSSVRHVARHHAGAGGEAVWLEVHRDGRVDLDGLRSALESGGPGQVVAVQAANLESGAVHPAAEVAAACAEAGARWFLDAAAIAGRAPVPAGWSVATAS